MFARFDADEDGAINLKEFEEAPAARAPGVTISPKA
jgi:Ca2+-binding EF-hand superfamily protein